MMKNLGLDGRWFVSTAAAALALTFAVTLPRGLSAEPGKKEAAKDAALAPEDRAETPELTPEEIWKQFAEYLESQGKADFLPRPERESEHEGEAVEAGADEEADKKAALHTPDFSRGDPIRGVLFRLSNDLINLDALFDDQEKARLDPEKRRKKIDKLVGRLKESKNPYLFDYGLYYEARHALEQGDHGKAKPALEKLVSSPRFLARSEARRGLVEACRRQGEETLAILELQFYLAGLDPHDAQGQLWAEEQLEEIRETHSGPLHDCVERAGSISELIALKKLGDPTQGEQRKVEDIFTKVAKLLEDRANRCPLCEKNASHCKQQAKQGKACKSGQCSAKKACQACGKGLAKGQGGQNAGGDPKGSRAQGGPANDSLLRRGTFDEVHLRDAKRSRSEAWGMINDREVAHSLRELLSKVPPSYRELVSRYFKDISDLEPPKKGKKAKKK